VDDASAGSMPPATSVVTTDADEQLQGLRERHFAERQQVDALATVGRAW